MTTFEHDPPAEDGAGREALAILRDAADALQRASTPFRSARIPLEQVENELARVMHIELARLLSRACDLRARCCNGEHDALVVALRSETREAIAIARSCGVVVPRALRRIVAGDPDTWPPATHLSRWAQRMDPCAHDSAILPDTTAC